MQIYSLLMMFMLIWCQKFSSLEIKMKVDNPNSANARMISLQQSQPNAENLIKVFIELKKSIVLYVLERIVFSWRQIDLIFTIYREVDQSAECISLFLLVDHVGVKQPVNRNWQHFLKVLDGRYVLAHIWKK